MQQLKINGKTVEVEGEPDTPLLWLLRGELHMTGTKFGCGMAHCGTYPRIRAAIRQAAGKKSA